MNDLKTPSTKTKPNNIKRVEIKNNGRTNLKDFIPPNPSDLKPFFISQTIGMVYHALNRNEAITKTNAVWGDITANDTEGRIELSKIDTCVVDSEDIDDIIEIENEINGSLREKGCPFCVIQGEAETGEDIPLYDNVTAFIRNDNILIIEIGEQDIEFNIRHCPICGREL